MTMMMTVIRFLMFASNHQQTCKHYNARLGVGARAVGACDGQVCARRERLRYRQNNRAAGLQDRGHVLARGLDAAAKPAVQRTPARRSSKMSACLAPRAGPCEAW